MTPPSPLGGAPASSCSGCSSPACVRPRHTTSRAGGATLVGMAQHLDRLVLGPRALAEVREALAARIAAGLERDGQEILALPAYLPQPAQHLAGRALVVDTGGT